MTSPTLLLPLLPLLPFLAQASPLGPSPGDPPPLIMITPQPITPPPRSTLLQGGRIIDGSGADPRVGDILIIDGRIAEIGVDLDPSLAKEVIPLDGAVVAPGLIDSHVHLTFAPGQALHTWDRETLDEHLKYHLKAYVAAGVTTVLDCAGVWSEVERVQGFVDAGAPAPRLLNLGEPPAIPGSYGPAVLAGLPTLTSQADLGPWLDAHLTHGPAGVKVLVEEGVLKTIWALPDDAWFMALKEEADARGIPLFAHAMGPEETLTAASLEPRAILHGLDRPNKDAIAAVKNSGAYVVPTLNIAASMQWSANPENLTSPLLALLAHPDELAALKDDTLRDASNLAVRDVASPGVPDWLALRMARNERFIRRNVDRRMDAARQLFEAGVPLVVGSDAPGWSVMLDGIPAWSTLQEMTLLGEVGMSPEEVFLAATRIPSEMLSLSREIGTLEVGKAADLVVMSGDPLASIEAWRDLSYVMKGGEIRTPAEWMAPRMDKTID